MLEQKQVADELWRREVDRRLDEHMERIDQHDELLKQGAESMTVLSDKIDANTLLTMGVKEDTAAMVSAFKAWGGFTTVTGWLIAIVVAAAALIVAGGVIYWFVTTGTLPKKVEGPFPVAHVARSFGARG